MSLEIPPASECNGLISLHEGFDLKFALWSFSVVKSISITIPKELSKSAMTELDKIRGY